MKNFTFFITILFCIFSQAQRYPPSSGGVTSVGSFGSSPNANGASISGTVLTMQPADSTHPGELKAADWVTFNSKQAALTFTAPLVNTTNTVTCNVASGSQPGCLASADWTTFNGKQASGNYITALVGDGTAAGPGSSTLTLATVNVNTGSFGSTSAIPSFTVNGKGLITAASTNVVVAPAGTLTGTTLASNVVTSSLTTVGTIGTGTWNGTTIATANGGTGQTSLNSTVFTTLFETIATTLGDLVYGGASGAPTRLAGNTTATKKYLSQTGTGTVSVAPAWSTFITPTISVATANNTSNSGGFSGSASVYTPPAGVLYIDIELCGGGGGGGGTGTSGQGASGNGTATTFGTTFLSGAGGTGGNNSVGGVGGAGSYTGITGSVLIAAVTGGDGGGAGLTVASQQEPGATGGSSFFGGGGAGNRAANGNDASAYCSGGGGGSAVLAGGQDTGAGGGAGGYLHALVTSSISATYAYSMATSGGAGGTFGISGFSGGKGKSGIIIVKEYYQ